jgi:hypothetical protein
MWWRSAWLFLLVATLTPASASPMRQWSVGNWHAGAYSNDASGDFSHCAANATYRSGIAVFFSISRDFHWAMAFANDAWQLQPGSTYNIAFTVDDMEPLSATAVAIGRDVVKVTLADSVELFGRFKRGHTLRVAAANRIFSFNLTNTSQLLPSLLACAQNRGAPVIASPNPFRERKQSPPITTAEDSASRAEATTFAANLLSSAGIQGFRLLTPTEFPELKGEARWIDGSTIGRVDILSQIKKENFPELAGILIGADAKSCKGSYLSGSMPEDHSGTLAKVFTSCQTDKKNVTIYYLAIPRSSGGAYVVSTASFGSEKPAKERSALIQSAAFKLAGVDSPEPKK